MLVQNQDFAANATERREGVSWSVQRWSIDAFATRDGTLRIPPIDVTVSVSVSAAREYQTTLQTESLTLTIEQPPELEGLDHWIASPEVTITQNVEGARDVFLGSAITRRVTVRAQDVMAMFLPPVDDPRVAGLQTYPQPPVLRNSSNRGSLIAERKELTTWIASTPGDLVIPEVSINWWNTTTRRLERLSTAPIPVTVQGQLPPKVLTWQQQIARALPWLVGLGIASALVLLGVYGQLARARRQLSKLLGLVYRSWQAWRQPVLADRLNSRGLCRRQGLTPRASAAEIALTDKGQVNNFGFDILSPNINMNGVTPHSAGSVDKAHSDGPVYRWAKTTRGYAA